MWISFSERIIEGDSIGFGCEVLAEDSGKTNKFFPYYSQKNIDDVLARLELTMIVTKLSALILRSGEWHPLQFCLRSKVCLR